MRKRGLRARDFSKAKLIPVIKCPHCLKHFTLQVSQQHRERCKEQMEQAKTPRPWWTEK